MSDEEIRTHLDETYHKAPPGSELIRERRGWYRIYGDSWPTDVPVMFLRLAERYGRRLEGLDGQHELDGDAAARVRDRALPLIAEAVELKWSSRVMTLAVRVRTQPQEEHGEEVVPQQAVDQNDPDLRGAIFDPEVDLLPEADTAEARAVPTAVAAPSVPPVQDLAPSPPRSPALDFLRGFVSTAAATVPTDRVAVAELVGDGLHGLLHVSGISEQEYERLLKIVSEHARGVRPEGLEGLFS
jgi:hypothetical protein